MVTRAPVSTTTLLLALAAAGCGETATPTAPAPVAAADAVAGVTGLSPAVGTTLAAGQPVTVTGTVSYTLNSAGTGVLYMIIQDQADKSLQTTQPTAEVVKGPGEVTLSQTITLPPTGVTGVRLFFALLPAGAKATNSTVVITYPVK